MKKTIPTFLFICLVSLVFTSCVDIVQTIDFKDGNYKIGYRLTINKTILAMADEEPSELFDEMDLSDVPEGISLTKIDTSLDVGLGFDAVVDPKAESKTKEFLPKVLKDGRIEIPLIFEEEFTSKESSEYDGKSEVMAKAMLSSAKWHVYITKKLVPSISKVYLENNYGTQNLEYFEIGDVFVINIPIILIEKDTHLRLEK